jgi:hypothetical protein
LTASKSVERAERLALAGADGADQLIERRALAAPAE